MTTLVEKIVQVHQSLTEANLPHGFGGALALAWCTEAARGTIDIDVNLFVETSQAAAALAALPAEVEQDKKCLSALKRDTQIRLWWDHTPVDIFLNNTPFHAEAATRLRWETFGGASVPFLACSDLAVFKAFFNRSKDWVDMETMVEAGTMDVRFVIGVISEYLGQDDERVSKLLRLVKEDT